MESNLRNEQSSNWNERKSNSEKPIFNDDNYDSPISERTSMASTLDEQSSPSMNRSEKPKRIKQSNDLRYFYNEMPSNGIPLATQYRMQKEEEKKNKKNERKAPPGQGKLVPLPENTTTTYENYYPYRRYFQTKNAEKITRTKEKVKNPTVDHDEIDVSRYLPDRSSLETPMEVSRRSKKKKKKSFRRQRRDYFSNDSKYSSSSSTHFIPLKDPDDDDDTYDSSGLKSRSGRRHRHHHRHHHHHHNHVPILPPVPTSKPPVQDPYVPHLMYENSEFNVIDDSYKRIERSPFILGSRQEYRLPPPSIYHQNEYLPPINPSPTYYAPLYYDRDWKENRPEPQVYKPDSQTRFYDRYLNNIIEKRLTAL